MSTLGFKCSLPEDKGRRRLQDGGINKDFLHRIHVAQEIMPKISGRHEIKIFCTFQKMIKGMKQQHTELKNIFAS